VDDLAVRVPISIAFCGEQPRRGPAGSARYEVDFGAGATVKGCVIRGVVRDPLHCISEKENVINAPSPQFDKTLCRRRPRFEMSAIGPRRNKPSLNPVGVAGLQKRRAKGYLFLIFGRDGEPSRPKIKNKRAGNYLVL
jgi:hypothetical protein